MDPAGIFDEMMLRGDKLRALRQLALADEEERAKQYNDESDESTHTTFMASTALHPQACPIANIELLEEKIHKYGSSGDLTETTATTSASDVGVILPKRSSLVLEDQIDTLPDSKLSVLRYESYLAHQRYYDDYKHSNCNFIDFPVVEEGKRIIVEQQKGLGKGGLVWDAAVVLTDHILAREADWRSKEGNKYDEINSCSTKIVDLGAGVGIAGLAIAKALPRTEVHITDLPELMPIMTRNVIRNFEDNAIVKNSPSTSTEGRVYTRNERGSAASDIPLCTDRGCKDLSQDDIRSLHRASDEEKLKTMKHSEGKVMAKVLRWGMKEDYGSDPYDVVIGADVVTSLYDPEALAHTIHSLCHEDSRVYMSLKNRLKEVVVQFEEVMHQLFSSVTMVKAISRNKNEDIIVMEVFGKRKR